MGFTENLQAILKARYGKDVRQSIHDGIKTCMDTIKVGLNEYDIRLSGAEKEHEDMKSEYQEPVKIAKEMRATDISLEIEEGYYWNMLLWSVNGKPKRSIRKIQGDEEISTYLQNVVLPVSPGEKYRIECAKFKPGHLGANVISDPIIAVEQVDHESASGYCGSMSEATDGVAIYDYVVPENANYLLVSHVQQPSNMDIVFRITQLFDTAKEYIQNIAGTPEEYQEKFSGAAAHNATCRGKKLGNALTGEMLAGIRDGSFSDLYVGDYIETEDNIYRFMDFDYFLGCVSGVSGGKIEKHHAVLVPDRVMGSSAIDNHPEATQPKETHMYANKLPEITRTLKSIFGNDNVAMMDRIIPKTANGEPTGWDWVNVGADLLTEEMVMGHGSWGQWPGIQIGVLKGQLAGFRYSHSLMCSNDDYWLRNKRSATNYALISSGGISSSDIGNQQHGVRPFFVIW